MSASQVQVKISLSDKLNKRIKSKAEKLGVPVTQYIKYLIIKEVEEEYPTFEASEWLEKRTKAALRDKDKAVEVDDIHEFFKKLK